MNSLLSQLENVRYTILKLGYGIIAWKSSLKKTLRKHLFQSLEKNNTYQKILD